MFLLISLQLTLIISFFSIQPVSANEKRERIVFIERRGKDRVRYVRKMMCVFDRLLHADFCAVT